jgi:hypothetical protein
MRNTMKAASVIFLPLFLKLLASRRSGVIGRDRYGRNGDSGNGDDGDNSDYHVLHMGTPFCCE